MNNRTQPKRANRIFQVADALDYGDAIGNIIRRNAKLLAEFGDQGPTLSLYAEARVVHETKVFHPTLVRADDGLIFHYWGYSELEDFWRTFPGPKVVHYHNITPPVYFPPLSRAYQMTRQGYGQLQRIADWFDLIAGDSNYNLVEYARFLSRPKPTIWIPPSIDVEAVRATPFDAVLQQQLRAMAQTNFLFVGRIAPNKRQDQIMRVFDYYYRAINPHSRLYLVGSFEPKSAFFRELQSLRQALTSGEQIIFTGKISDEAVQAYYRAADVFVSASEHEGFGVPLLEAMVHNIPVVALATTAVPETMGQAGILIHRWDVARVAELINLLLEDEPWRVKVLADQQQNLQRFSTMETRQRLAAVVDFLREKRESPFIVWRGPGIMSDETNTYSPIKENNKERGIL